MSTHALRTAGLLTIALALPRDAGAQTAPPLADDFQRAQVDAALGTSPGDGTPVAPTFGATFARSAAGGTPAPFSFTGIGPFNYVNSYATTQVTAVQATPELKFGLSAQPNGVPLKFTAALDASSSRNTSTLKEGDGAYLLIRVDWTGHTPNRQAWAPFLSYSPQLGYKPTFAARSSEQHDVIAGAVKIWDFYKDWTPINPHAAATIFWEVAFQGRYQHRIVDGSPNSNAALLTGSLKGIMSPTLAASFQVGFTRRWLDEADGISEHTWDAQPILTIAYTLPSRWFGQNGESKAFGSPELDFQIAYANHRSTVDAHAFHTWSLGPTVNASWKF